jgi:hypothetical protein
MFIHSRSEVQVGGAYLRRKAADLQKTRSAPDSNAKNTAKHAHHFCNNEGECCSSISRRTFKSVRLANIDERNTTKE